MLAVRLVFPPPPPHDMAPARNDGSYNLSLGSHWKALVGVPAHDDDECAIRKPKAVPRWERRVRKTKREWRR